MGLKWGTLVDRSAGNSRTLNQATFLDRGDHDPEAILSTITFPDSPTEEPKLVPFQINGQHS